MYNIIRIHIGKFHQYENLAMDCRLVLEWFIHVWYEDAFKYDMSCLQVHRHTQEMLSIWKSAIWWCLQVWSYLRSYDMWRLHVFNCLKISIPTVYILWTIVLRTHKTFRIFLHWSWEQMHKLPYCNVVSALAVPSSFHLFYLFFSA